MRTLLLLACPLLLAACGRPGAAPEGGAHDSATAAGVLPGDSPDLRRDEMGVVLFVRIKSDLDAEELDRRLLERRPRFLEVPGLLQKVYGRDRATGDLCGIYFFESQAALDAFRETELAQTIPSAYEAVEVRREVYDVLYPLRPGRGPFGD